MANAESACMQRKHALGEELVTSYLYQVHLYDWLEMNDCGRFLSDRELQVIGSPGRMKLVANQGWCRSGFCGRTGTARWEAKSILAGLAFGQNANAHPRALKPDLFL